MPQKYCFGCFRTIEESEEVCPICGYRHGSPAGVEYALEPGSSLQDDKFLLGRMLSMGGFGITYIALDRTLNLRVAIKEYYPQGQANRSLDGRSVCWHGTEEEVAAGKESFQKEARKMAKLHAIPGIVQVREVFSENNTAYIAMDYVEGETLKTILKQSGVMKPEDCIELLSPVIQALGEAHASGMIHRDVSPDNIMVDIMGRRWLLDMGSAKDLDNSTGQTQSTQGAIKRGFSPPEQYTDRKRVGTWSDIYAMCATLYYCMTGRLAPDAMERVLGDSIEFPEGFPDGLKETLLHGLALRPEERIRTMGELQKDLNSWMQSRKTEAPISVPEETEATQKPPENSEGKETPGKKRRASKWLLILLLCAVLGIGSFFLIHNIEKEDTLTDPSGSIDRVGSIITFGCYEQDNKTSNGAEPLEWTVLDVRDGKSLLISRYGLERMAFYSGDSSEVTWEASSARNWLYNIFPQKAFTQEELKAIAVSYVDNGYTQRNSAWNTFGGKDTYDRFFCLSYQEAHRYFDSDKDRACRLTAYAKAQPGDSSGAKCWWWLRSPGEEQHRAGCVSGDGTVVAIGVDSSFAALRPAMWVDIEAFENGGF